jgi:recombination protein RecA
MIKKCETCDADFEAKRASAKYCSPTCRKAAARKAGVDIETGEVLKPSNSTPLETEQQAYQRRLDGFQRMGLIKVDWITTGIPELDAFQMIPRGRVTQIQGPFAVGKTTLALNMIKGLKNKKILYIDSEASLNPELLAKLELEPNNFHLYNESAYIEDMYDQVLLGAKDGSYDMVIIDSLAACTTKTEEAGDVTARNIGQKALIVNKLMRIVPMICKNTDTALVIINQEREMIGTYTPTKYTPGGMGPVYAASLILGLKTIKSWRFPKDAKDGEYKGHEIEVTILKSKVSQPHRKTKVKLYYMSDELQPIPAPLVAGEF